jgi:IS5 family transposase
VEGGDGRAGGGDVAFTAAGAWLGLEADRAGARDQPGVARHVAEINAQLAARGPLLGRGTLIDASISRSAARPPAGDAGEVSAHDPDAGFTKKNGKTSFGYKAHIGTDEGSNLIRRAVMTTAQLHDSQACDALIQDDEAAVYGTRLATTPSAATD